MSSARTSGDPHSQEFRKLQTGIVYFVCAYTQGTTVFVVCVCVCRIWRTDLRKLCDRLGAFIQASQPRAQHSTVVGWPNAIYVRALRLVCMLANCMSASRCAAHRTERLYFIFTRDAWALQRSPHRNPYTYLKYIHWGVCDDILIIHGERVRTECAHMRTCKRE